MRHRPIVASHSVPIAQRLVARGVATLVLAAALVEGAAPSAAAGNADGAFIGGDAALTAGSVVSRAGIAEAAWHNPAGLANLAWDRIDASATVFAVRDQGLDHVIRSSLPGTELVSDLDSRELLVVPSTLVGTYRIDDGLELALGFYTPKQDYLSSSSLVTSDLGNPKSAGNDRYQQRVDLLSDEVDYQAGASVGWALASDLRLGGGLFGTYSSVNERLLIALAVPALLTGTPTASFASGTAETSGDSYGLELMAGVQWDADPCWTLGLSVRGPNMSLIRSGRAATLVTGVSGANPGGEFITEVRDFSVVGFELVAPARISAGGLRRFEWGWAAGQVDLETPLENPDFAIDRGVVVNGRAGLAYLWSDTWTLGAGFYTDLSARQDRNDIGDRVTDFYGFTVGAERKTLLALRDDARPDGLTMRTVVAVRYAYGTGSASALDITVGEDGNVDIDSTRSNVSSQVHELALYVGGGLDY